MGASGAGKTYLACAFGIAACRNFYPVKARVYIEVNGLQLTHKISSKFRDLGPVGGSLFF
ncbi:ATP-binding protein [Paenibacillus piri]|uniref:ATP-binding protein n=1 Tax=Paenibacillus piri TaxID=2547395 RepID=UPI003CCC577F